MRSEIRESATVVDLAVRGIVNDKGTLPEFAYFPVSAVISNVSTMNDGSSIEVGIIGREGMTGFPLILTGAAASNNLYAQIAGSTLRVPAPTMVRIITRTTDSWLPFTAYAEATVTALSQYAACNRLHEIEQRFARWLLMAHDRVPGDEVWLTHEFLSLMLGVRRAGVTAAASGLQEAGVIQYKRGHIVIRDRPALQKKACECYDTVEDRFQAVLGFSIRKNGSKSR